MTAPDPGLTDLIAAHAHLPQFMRCSCGDDLWKYPEGGHAAHVALVVEQHTNGRITELEAELAEVTDKWGLISHLLRSRCE